MLCNKCNKYEASIINKQTEPPEGLCLLCAYRYRVEPIKSLLEGTNIVDMDVEKITRNLSKDAMRKAELKRQEEKKENHQKEQKSAPAAYNRANVYNGGCRMERENGEQEGQNVLEDVCINLTARAGEGKLDPIFGREEEISHIIRILCRKSKNNPCLIGEPGTGKTAIAEALCQRIVNDDVPSDLHGKEVYLLDLSSLVAGTQYRGQFEARVKKLVSEIVKRGNCILFIDEIHNLVGAGGNENSMNAANILKPALSRGEIQIIGATTLSEYRKNIERDGALERRFQPVLVEEPSLEDAYSILKGAKGRFERHHGVSINDEVVEFAVTLSERYITDRYLPDKAIDLIDEGCVIAKLKDYSRRKIAEVDRELREVGATMADAIAHRSGDFQQEIHVLQMAADELTMKKEKLQKTAKRPALTYDHLADVIESWTGIPASRVSQSELERLVTLGDRLKTRIIDQDEAIDVICSGIKRNRAGLSPKRKPVSMIFAGPTGVGKTELVKTLALDLFDTPDSLIRLDMSEFMEKHSVSRIIGAPPGYLGYDDAGQLTEQVRRKPYCVILFDEIEKAHPDVLNILLQILDDGRISDSHGKAVSFENCIIIMTTNAGFSYDDIDGKNDRTKVMEALYRFLRPEFLNRVDDIVVFNRLTKDSFKSIGRIILGDIKEAAGKSGLAFGYNDDVIDYLANRSYSREFGARALRRLIQREVENKLADYMIGVYGKNIEKVTAKADENQLIFDAAEKDE